MCFFSFLSSEFPAYKRSWSPSDCSAPASTGKATSLRPWAPRGQSTPTRDPLIRACLWVRRCWELWERSEPHSCGDRWLGPSWWPCLHQRTKEAWGSSTSCSDGWRRRRSASLKIRAVVFTADYFIRCFIIKLFKYWKLNVLIWWNMNLKHPKYHKTWIRICKNSNQKSSQA